MVSTVPGGLETPDFLELRKNASRPDDSGPKQLYHVVQEKQTTIRGVMGSERGYDVSGITGHVPVLGDERGTKVSLTLIFQVSWQTRIQIVLCRGKPMALISLWTLRNWKGCLMRSYGRGTMLCLAGPPVFQEALLARTFRIW